MERKVVRYSGTTTDKARGRYNADATAASAAGWVVEDVQWKYQASQPTLLVSYVPTPPPMPASPSAAKPDERPNASTVCPSCGVTLDPLPKAKKKCPACGEAIYVRSGPDGMRYLLSEQDLEAHEATWEAHDDQKALEEGARHNLEPAQSAQRQLAEYAEYGVKGVEMLMRVPPAWPTTVASNGWRMSRASLFMVALTTSAVATTRL